MLGQALSDASRDLLRHLLGTVINSLLSADADAVCGAEYGVPSPERVNSRNGYRHRELDTRVGTIDVANAKVVVDSTSGNSVAHDRLVFVAAATGQPDLPRVVRAHADSGWCGRQ